jgi:hypothetical protein
MSPSKIDETSDKIDRTNSDYDPKLSDNSDDTDNLQVTS